MIRSVAELYFYSSTFVDLEFLSSWNDPSGIRTLFIFVHFCGLRIFILLGWSVQLVDFIYIRPLLWTWNFHPPGMIRLVSGLSFLPVHFCGLRISILLGWSIRYPDFVYIHLILWTWNFHPSGMIRPLYGLYENSGRKDIDVSEYSSSFKKKKYL